MDNYIIDIKGTKYVKDAIKNRMLRVDEVVHVTTLPSNGKEKTLYVLPSSFYYSNNSVYFQVELEEIKKPVVEKKMDKE